MLIKSVLDFCNSFSIEDTVFGLRKHLCKENIFYFENNE